MHLDVFSCSAKHEKSKRNTTLFDQLPLTNVKISLKQRLEMTFSDFDTSKIKNKNKQKPLKPDCYLTSQTRSE